METNEQDDVQLVEQEQVYKDRHCPHCGAIYQDVIDEVNRQLAEAAFEDMEEERRNTYV